MKDSDSPNSLRSLGFLVFPGCIAPMCKDENIMGFLDKLFGHRDSDDEGHSAKYIEYLTLGFRIKEVFEVIGSGYVLDSKHDE